MQNTEQTQPEQNAIDAPAPMHTLVAQSSQVAGIGSASINPDVDPAPLQPQTAQKAEQTSESEKSEKKPKRTRGEVIFDWGNYGGLAWIANAALSVGVAYGLKHTEAGAPVFDSVVNFFKKNVHPHLPAYKNAAPEAIEAAAKATASVTALTPGGFALMIPVKLLEDKKEEHVTSLNEKFGSGLSGDEEKRSLEHLHNEPKQTWTSELTGRVIAVSAVLGLAIPFAKDYVDPQIDKLANTGMFSGFKSKMNQWLGDKNGDALDQQAKDWNKARTEKLTELGKADLPFRKAEPIIDELIEKGKLLEKPAESIGQKLAHMSIADVGYSAYCAGVLYVASKGLAAFSQRHEHNEKAVAKKSGIAHDTLAEQNVRLPEPTATANAISDISLQAEQPVPAVANTASFKMTDPEGAPMPHISTVIYEGARAANAPEQDPSLMA